MAKLLVVALLGWLGWQWWQAQTRRMPIGEARALLGVEPGATADEIRAAHRRIIQRVHPDAGGTPELARRTNIARDLLLAEAARSSAAVR